MKVIRESDVARCKTQSRDPAHWRPDGTCKHMRPRTGQLDLKKPLRPDGIVAVFTCDDLYDFWAAQTEDDE